METLLQVILIFSVIKFACKATFYKHDYGIWIFAVSAAAFAYFIHPYVIAQNGNFYNTLLSKSNRVTDLAVIITIESISGILISIGMLQNYLNSQNRAWKKMLKLTPGILIAGAMFYIEQKVFYMLAGLNFKLTAFITAIGVFFLIIIISTIIKFFLSSGELRYEFKFLVNIFLLLTAIVLNAGLANYNRSNYNTESGLDKLFIFISIVLLLGAIGYLLKINKNQKYLKIIRKWI